MRILHFSDFHLRPNGLGKRSMDIFNRMKEKLQEINQEENIDLVIFSGDMIDKGGKDFNISLDECFQDFKKNIIKPLVESLHIGYHQFYLFLETMKLIEAERIRLLLQKQIVMMI